MAPRVGRILWKHFTYFERLRATQLYFHKIAQHLPITIIHLTHWITNENHIKYSKQKYKHTSNKDPVFFATEKTPTNIMSNVDYWSPGKKTKIIISI